MQPVIAWTASVNAMLGGIVNRYYSYYPRLHLPCVHHVIQGRHDLPNEPAPKPIPPLKTLQGLTLMFGVAECDGKWLLCDYEREWRS